MIAGITDESVVIPARDRTVRVSGTLHAAMLCGIADLAASAVLASGALDTTLRVGVAGRGRAAAESVAGALDADVPLQVASRRSTGALG